MRTFSTHIKAIDPIDGEMKTWAGPNVIAKSFEEAKIYC